MPSPSGSATEVRSVLEPDVARAVDLPHPSFAELGGDLVRTETGAER